MRARRDANQDARILAASAENRKEKMEKRLDAFAANADASVGTPEFRTL
jgi:hypothetical protein